MKKKTKKKVKKKVQNNYKTVLHWKDQGRPSCNSNGVYIEYAKTKRQVTCQNCRRIM